MFKKILSFLFYNVLTVFFILNISLFCNLIAIIYKEALNVYMLAIMMYYPEWAKPFSYFYLNNFYLLSIINISLTLLSLLFFYLRKYKTYYHLFFFTSLIAILNLYLIIFNYNFSWELLSNLIILAILLYVHTYKMLRK